MINKNSAPQNISDIALILATLCVMAAISAIFYFASGGSIFAFALSCFIIAIAIPKFFALSKKKVDFLYYTLAIVGIVSFHGAQQETIHKFRIEQERYSYLKTRGELFEALSSAQRNDFLEQNATLIAMAIYDILESAYRFSEIYYLDRCKDNNSTKYCKRQSAIVDLFKKFHDDHDQMLEAYINQKSEDKKTISLKYIRLLRGVPPSVVFTIVKDIGQRRINGVWMNAVDIVGFAFDKTREKSKKSYINSIEERLKRLELSHKKNQQEMSKKMGYMSSIYIWFMQIWPFIVCLALALKLARDDHLSWI